MNDASWSDVAATVTVSHAGQVHSLAGPDVDRGGSVVQSHGSWWVTSWVCPSTSHRSTTTFADVSSHN